MSSGDLFGSTVTVLTGSSGTAAASEVWFSAVFSGCCSSAFAAAVSAAARFTSCTGVSDWMETGSAVFSSAFAVSVGISAFTGVYSGISPAGTQISPLLAATVTLMQPPWTDTF